MRGGRIFYFQKEIQTVITNAVRWAAPLYMPAYSTGWQKSVEPIHTYEDK